MQLSTIIGKPILTRAGEQLGYVTGVCLTRDLKKLAALAAADGDEEEFYLPARAVLSLSDAIIASAARIPAPTGLPSPVGLPAFSPNGDTLGTVCDLLFGDEEPVLILSREGVRTAVPVCRAAIGESVIVYGEGEKPAARKIKPRAPQEAPAPVPKKAPSAEPKEQTKEVKYDLGGRNLLGRRVIRSVFDADGKLVAAAGERITPDILSRARRKGRLVALTVNTLTNI